MSQESPMDQPAASTNARTTRDVSSPSRRPNPRTQPYKGPPRDAQPPQVRPTTHDNRYTPSPPVSTPILAVQADRCCLSYLRTTTVITVSIDVVVERNRSAVVKQMMRGERSWGAGDTAGGWGGAWEQAGGRNGEMLVGLILY